MNENKNTVLNSAPTKPTSLIIEDFKNNIISEVNKTNLPASVIEPVMKDIYNQIHILCINQYEKEKKEYEAALAEYNDSFKTETENV